MSEYLERAGREALAAQIAERIAAGDEVVHVLYEPGDSTAYDLVLAKVDERERVQATYYRPEIMTSPHFFAGAGEPERWLLAWPGFTAMTVDVTPGHYTDPSYVMEKMGIGAASGACIAELLNMVTGVDTEILDSMRETYAGWSVFRAEAQEAAT